VFKRVFFSSFLLLYDARKQPLFTHLGSLRTQLHNGARPGTFAGYVEFGAKTRTDIPAPPRKSV